MGFVLFNYSLKIRESIGISTPKMGAHLGMWGFIPSHSPTLPWAWDVTPRNLWLTPLQALALVASLGLGLWHLSYEKHLLNFVTPLMGGHVESFWNLVVASCQGGTTIIGGWLISDWPISSPSTCGPISRSIGKWLTYMSPTCIWPTNGWLNKTSYES
jgi:hypothetical protein